MVILEFSCSTRRAIASLAKPGQLAYRRIVVEDFAHEMTWLLPWQNNGAFILDPSLSATQHVIISLHWSHPPQLPRLNNASHPLLRSKRIEKPRRAMAAQLSTSFNSEMSTTSHFILAKPIPRRARPTANRPASPTSGKQLSAKIGSASAPDPHATRTARPARTTITKLTVVRVPQPEVDEGGLENSPKKLQRRQTVERASGMQRVEPTRLSLPSASFSTPTSPTKITRTVSQKPASLSRVSFASTSFASVQRSRSLVAAPRHARATSSPFPMLPSFERMAPAQLHGLAMVSSRPSVNVLPTEYPPSSLFMPLTEEIYLPFLDRPTEVLELMTKSDNKKLMVLFARMLPASNEMFYPRTSAELAATVGSWTFEDFTTWLTQISREEIEDEEWVRALRLFVLPKSEVLWERIKGMLGVPPELDVDPEFEDEEKRRLSAKDATLHITPIFPASFSSGRHLDNILETVGGERTTKATDEIVGLRILTSITLPPSPGIAKFAKTVPSSPRARSPSQGYAPAVSSPLVPKPLRQPRPMSAPPQKSISGTLLPGLLSKIRSKDLACPMFPTSFDKLGMQPTMLHII